MSQKYLAIYFTIYLWLGVSFVCSVLLGFLACFCLVLLLCCFCLGYIPKHDFGLPELRKFTPVFGPFSFHFLLPTFFGCPRRLLRWTVFALWIKYSFQLLWCPLIPTWPVLLQKMLLEVPSEVLESSVYHLMGFVLYSIPISDSFVHFVLLPCVVDCGKFPLQVEFP